jgi:thiosulfate dehydrogenase (quinone) large subunit
MTDHTVIALRREPGALTRSLTALLLRVGLGLAFLMFGLQKFEAMKQGKYPAMITQSFEGTALGQRMPGGVRLFAAALPYAEVALGGLLIAGALTTLTATLTGLLLLNLMFGLLVQGDPSKVNPLLIYLLVDAAILWLSPVTSNYLSLDGLLLGWFWRPKGYGEYRREDAAERLGKL